MTNTSFRKKALLSSIAMLLVAFIALGSATFAWFFAQPDAAADDGIAIKATASKGLVLQSASERTALQDYEATDDVGDAPNTGTIIIDEENDLAYWSHGAKFNVTSYNGSAYSQSTDALPIIPVSMNTDGACYTMSAASDGSYEHGDSAATGATAGTDYYAEDLYFKVTGGEAGTVKIKGVSWDLASGSQLATAVRVAIIYNGSVIATFADGADSNLYLTSAAVYNTAKSSSARVCTAKAETLSEQITIASSVTSGTIKVAVYLDGEDEAVYSQNIASADLTKIMDNINVSLVVA